MALDPVKLKTLAIQLAAAMPPAPPPPDAQFAADVTPRTRMMRAIVRIANAHRWEDGIVHFLETKGVPYLSDLTDPQIADLHSRMLGYVEAAENGYSLPDCLPAH